MFRKGDLVRHSIGVLFVVVEDQKHFNHLVRTVSAKRSGYAVELFACNLKLIGRNYKAIENER